ncbi:MAG TPA: endolytic transglycosylase MltG [Negativicutes bacterium]|nr:endolytic transglycosylase MltG [Negativicutes bacterium]
MKTTLKNMLIILSAIMLAVVLLFVWEMYIPKSFAGAETVRYTARSGMGAKEIATDLKERGVIKSSLFFNAYAFITGSHGKLQAGLYDISPSMSVAGIINTLVSGNVARHKITVIEGWDLRDIADYLEEKDVYYNEEFAGALEMDFSGKFSFLTGKPEKLGLEGYIFPDTYYIPAGSSAEDFLNVALQNFDRKLTPAMREQITKDKRSIFQIVTMASILEKEVNSLEDKKIVSGILWKRLSVSMPLQVDATINYITNKNDPGVTLADTKIDSPYNTYKYYGLPLGPISNPGLDSLMAAVYPQKSDYWYYLSELETGKTIFSKTFQEHQSSIKKYFKSVGLK